MLYISRSRHISSDCTATSPLLSLFSVVFPISSRDYTRDKVSVVLVHRCLFRTPKQYNDALYICLSKHLECCENGQQAMEISFILVLFLALLVF